MKNTKKISAEDDIASTYRQLILQCRQSVRDMFAGREDLEMIHATMVAVGWAMAGEDFQAYCELDYVGERVAQSVLDANFEAGRETVRNGD